jgi:NADPH-ferrihemoprotein reductase
MMATHYEGEPCDNTVNFYKWIKANKKQKSFFKPEKLNFAVFGLGDTAYEHFNAMGKFFDQTFEEIGGTRVFKAGVGNSENLMTETQFDEWKSQLWSRIADHYRGKPGGDKERAKQVPSTKESQDK